MSVPRMPSQPGVGQPSDGPFWRPPDPDDELLARWLSETERARTDPTGSLFWRLTNSPIFADLWYEARAAGERARARAVASLYARNAHPGGRYPDPREPATYSERAIVIEAFHQLGVPIWPQPPCSQHDPSEPLVMLVTYRPHDRLPPKLVIHAEMQQAPQALLLFHMACMLGFLTREQLRHLDPDAPPQNTLLPTNHGALAVLHQFAFAFLYLEPICPPEWGCPCNDIRARFNAPPEEHSQPTQTMTLADLRQNAPPTHQDTRQDRHRER